MVTSAAKTFAIVLRHCWQRSLQKLVLFRHEYFGNFGGEEVTRNHRRPRRRLIWRPTCIAYWRNEGEAPLAESMTVT